MGSRGRSIRLRIYFLVAIPLITMLGLFGYVAYTSVTNFQNQDRAPSLIDATAEPLTNFVNVLQAERRAAVVYLSQPDSGSLAVFRSAATATGFATKQLAVAINSVGTKDSTTPAETAAIGKMTSQVDQMTTLRDSVTAKKLTPLDAFADYTNIIAGQGAVLQAEADSLTAASPVLQGLGLTSAVNTQEDVSEQDAVLAGALASGSLTGADRVVFSDASGRLQDDMLTYQQLLTPAELATYQTVLNQAAPAAIQTELSTIQQAVQAGTPLSELAAQGLTPASWQGLTKTWLTASSKAGTSSAVTVLAANRQPAIDAKRRVWITAAVGLAGLILTLIVTILLGQSINRRLAALRKSALTLAQEQLPAVVARLRRGESVDVAAEAPPLQAGNDEIGQVSEAIDAVRQTAIQSAVDEAKVRQGVNDMFRNLARRNQSLLQRQLTVLDDMERRATDPDVLEDLFKMDHLTTRMRRHAEGLIILSGAAPGRSWSAPVKLVDVMRGAVAEVEDYARVTVSTQTRATLAGSAVTDVIHLLAELIENATSLSPPFTQVRVSGETVAHGFAIEIEDRGLGMVPQRLQELNERLANPPDINPANTEQLGLFVVGQLARRHGIKVVLRPSPYGGTTAIALLPLALIVEEGPAAIAPGGRAPAGAGNDSYSNGAYSNGAYSNGAYDTGAHDNGTAGNGSYANGSYANGSSPNGTYDNGTAGNGAYRNGASGNGSPGYAGPAAGGSQTSWSEPGSWPPPTAPSGRPQFPDGQPQFPDWRPEPSGPSYAGPAAYGNAEAFPEAAVYPSPGARDPRDRPAAAGGYPAGPQDPAGPPIRISGALRQPGTAAGHSTAAGYAAPGGRGPAGPGIPLPEAGPAGGGPRRARSGPDDVPVVTGVPVGRQALPPVPSFDVFTPVRRPGPGSGPAGSPATYPYPDDGSAYPGGAAYPGGTAVSGVAPGGAADGAREPAAGAAQGDPGEVRSLPRRVRQASLAPQLRTSATPSAPAGPAAVPAATAASLDDMRTTLSAMQRGWQQGRAQTQPDTEGGADGN